MNRAAERRRRQAEAEPESAATAKCSKAAAAVTAYLIDDDLAGDLPLEA